MIVSQPNNFLITRMGLSSLWIPPAVSAPALLRYSTTAAINLTTYLKIMFKSGVIYSHHPFFLKFFVVSEELLSLPIYMTEDTFPKFYRIHRLKASLHFTMKRTLTLRRSLQYLNLSDIHFYRLGSAILTTLNIHLPAIVKRGKPSEVKRAEREELKKNRLSTQSALTESDQRSFWNIIWSFYNFKLFGLSCYNLRIIF